MAVQKELSCPSCKKALPFGDGFEHDNELNFICSYCKKIIFGVTPQAEEEVKKHLIFTSSVMGFHAPSRREPLPIRLNNVQEDEPQASVETTCCDQSDFGLFV